MNVVDTTNLSTVWAFSGVLVGVYCGSVQRAQAMLAPFAAKHDPRVSMSVRLHDRVFRRDLAIVIAGLYHRGCTVFSNVASDSARPEVADVLV